MAFVKTLLTLLFTAFTLLFYGQPKRLLCHNLATKTTDTIEIPDFDTSVQHEFTPSYFGSFNYSASDLPLNTNNLPLFPNADFSRKKVVQHDFDLNSYPIRTAVRIFAKRADSIYPICSGSMVSNRHVLTANHCVADLVNDSIKFDSLKVCVAYDWGKENANFGCVWISKIYAFENWQISNSDLTLLELSSSVGTETGWIGLEFHTDYTSLFSPIHYKLSYPSIYAPNFDSIPYNGDTLYYNVGKIDWADSTSFGVANATGIPGESGSSLFYFNGKGYVTNGVLSTALRFRHCRLTRWQYFSFKEIIKNSWNTEYIPPYSDDLPLVYPNPASEYFRIKTHRSNSYYSVRIFTTNGTLVKQIDNYLSNQIIHTYSLPTGLYFIAIKNDNESFTKKWIKSY